MEKMNLITVVQGCARQSIIDTISLIVWYIVHQGHMMRLMLAINNQEYWAVGRPTDFVDSVPHI